MATKKIYSGAENSVFLNPNKILGQNIKDTPRPKTNALGDVRNTVHTRLAKTPVQKSEIFTKKTDVKVCSNIKTSSSYKPKLNILTTEEQDKLNFHNHSKCIQAEDYKYHHYLNECKLSELDIQTIVQSLEFLRLPKPKLNFQPPSPKEDIKFSEHIIQKCNDDESDDEFLETLPKIRPPYDQLFK